MGHTEVASLLLTTGAAVNQTGNSGGTPLHATCHNGYTEVASLLLTNGAAVDQTGNSGYTTLAAACQEGDLSCVQLLSSYGASRTFALQLHAAVLEVTAERLAQHRGRDEILSSTLLVPVNS